MRASSAQDTPLCQQPAAEGRVSTIDDCAYRPAPSRRTQSPPPKRLPPAAATLRRCRRPQQALHLRLRQCWRSTGQHAGRRRTLLHSVCVANKTIYGRRRILPSGNTESSLRIYLRMRAQVGQEGIQCPRGYMYMYVHGSTGQRRSGRVARLFVAELVSPRTYSSTVQYYTTVWLILSSQNPSPQVGRASKDDGGRRRDDDARATRSIVPAAVGPTRTRRCARRRRWTNFCTHARADRIPAGRYR